MFLFKSKKSPYYQIIYIDNGRRYQISTKKKTKSEALKFLNNFEKGTIRKREHSNINLSGFQKKYSNYVKVSFSKKYYSIVNHSFKLFIEFIGNKTLNNVTSFDVENFILNKHQTSKHAASLYYRTLKAAFNKAIVWNYISTNPFVKIKLPKIEKPLPSFITQSELDLVNSHVPQMILKEIYQLLFHTGLRANECLNLEWKDVNLLDRVITIRNKKNFTVKNKRERTIPLNSTAYTILNKRYHKFKAIDIRNNLVFKNSKGIVYSVDYISKQFKKAVREAKIDERIHLHSLRHSFCSNLVSKGVSLYVVKDLVGHENISTTQIYSHLNKETLLQAVNLLD